MVVTELAQAAKQTLGALSRLIKTLVSLHLELARVEAEEEARRLQAALLLMAIAALTFTVAAILLHLGIVVVAHDRGLDWAEAVFVVAGADVLIGAVCLGVAGRRLNKAWMPRTRERVAETVNSLADSGP